jgi:1-phosphofructokinase
MAPNRYDCLAITLNPAIDRTITISNFQAGKVNRVQGEYSNAGGRRNVASSLADAGHKIAVTGFLGRENASLFERLFTRKRIADHFVRLDGETRVGIKVTDPVLKETTDINFPGAEPLPSDLAALRSVIDHTEAEWFVIAGSLPPGVEITIYRDFTESLKSLGRKVALDASGEALNHAIEALPAFIKPNIHELEGLVGRALPTVTKLQGRLESWWPGVSDGRCLDGRTGRVFVGAGAFFCRRQRSKFAAQLARAMRWLRVLSAKLRGLSLAETARLSTTFCAGDRQARGDVAIRTGTES